MKDLRQILNDHLHEIKAGHADKLESQIKAWIEETIIGQDDKRVVNRKGFYPPYQPNVEKHKRAGRNELRQSQRQQLKDKL